MGVRGVHAAAPLFVALGNLETRMLAGRLASQRVDRPVYICGLPRAGTTITLQMLSEHPDVVTHKYADFLMPYMPWVWNNVFPRIPVDAMRKPVPRIHRDRIEVTRDSAEMGEEILWEHFFPHIHDETKYSVLDATTSNPAFEHFYSDHLRKLALVRGRSRYVSKAIMCVVRMQYLRRLFPDARFLLYVRNPIDHVASLIKQDRIWAELERADPRQIEIIELTGHHEFGTRQVMANVGNPDELREIRRLFDAGKWAQSRARYWAYMYGFVAQSARTQIPTWRAASALCATKTSAATRLPPSTEFSRTPVSTPQSFAAARETYSKKLSFPDYYKPAFDADTLGEIVAATSGIAQRFGYDVAAIAAKVGGPPPEPTSV